MYFVNLYKRYFGFEIRLLGYDTYELNRSSTITIDNLIYDIETVSY